MGLACAICGERRDGIKDFGGDTNGKRPLARHDGKII
jgi:hypothetical protein